MLRRQRVKARIKMPAWGEASSGRAMGAAVNGNPFLNAEAVLFDLDGTLVETHIDFPFMKDEMLGLVERFGVDSASVQPLDILSIVEESRNHLVRHGRAEDGARLRAEAFARLEEIEVDQCRNPVEIPGAAELLRRLRQMRVRVGIVTRNCRRVSLNLAEFGSLTHDSSVTRDDVPITKPDPAHLLAALSHLGISPERLNARTPERVNAVMVGDHWMDVKAGRAAGVATVGILHGREPGFFKPAQPDLLVEKLADLLPLVA